MARKSFLLRMDPALLTALQRWAEEDFRSLNGQIEFLLKQAVVKRGMKLPTETEANKQQDSETGNEST